MKRNQNFLFSNGSNSGFLPQQIDIFFYQIATEEQNFPKPYQIRSRKPHYPPKKLHGNARKQRISRNNRWENRTVGGGRRKGSPCPDLTLWKEETSGSPLFPGGKPSCGGLPCLRPSSRRRQGRRGRGKRRGKERTGGEGPEMKRGHRGSAVCVSTGSGPASPLRVATCNRVSSLFLPERRRWPWLDPR